MQKPPRFGFLHETFLSFVQNLIRFRSGGPSRVSRGKIFLGFVYLFIVSFDSLTRLQVFYIYTEPFRVVHEKTYFFRVCMLIEQCNSSKFLFIIVRLRVVIFFLLLFFFRLPVSFLRLSPCACHFSFFVDGKNVTSVCSTCLTHIFFLLSVCFCSVLVFFGRHSNRRTSLTHLCLARILSPQQTLVSGMNFN